MIKDLGLEIMDAFGDYSYGSFDEGTSNFIIYRMRKKYSMCNKQEFLIFPAK